MKLTTERYYANAARVGAQLRRIRQAQGLKVTEVAKKAGFSQQQLSAVECGRVNTPIETLAKIAGVLHVPLEELVMDPLIRRDTFRLPPGTRIVKDDELVSIAQKADEAHQKTDELAELVGALRSVAHV